MFVNYLNLSLQHVFCAPSVIGSALQSIDKILQFIGTLVLHLIKALNQFGSYTPLLRGDHYGSS